MSPVACIDRRLGGLLLALAAHCAACSDEAPSRDYGDPSAAVATTVDGITARLLAPSAATTSQRVSVEVAASIDPSLDDADAPLEVSVSVGGGPAIALTNSGDDGVYRGEVGVVHGDNAVDVAIRTADGAHFRRVQSHIDYAGDVPGLRVARLSATCDADAAEVAMLTRAESLCVWLEATSGAAPLAEVTLASDDHDASGMVASSGVRAEVGLMLALTRDRAQLIHARVRDDAGAIGRADVTVTQDATPPVLVVDTSVPAQTGAASLALAGTVDDANGIAALWLEDAAGGRLDIAVSDDDVEWRADAPLVAGANALSLVAADRAGNTARIALAVERTRRFVLQAPLPSGAPVTLSLDRQALGELVGEADQKRLVLANVDLRPAMVQAFKEVRSPELYGVDTSTWGPREWNANRVLNLTPDTMDVTGTSMENLLAVSQAVGLPPARILAETFGVGVTDNVLSGEDTVDALIDHVVGSHPNAAFDENGKPIFVLSLYDVLQDLRTLGERYGPVGDHPGLVGPVSRGDLLEPGFAMNVTARSQFVRYDGVDGARDARDYLFVLPPETPAVAFDFMDPSTFEVVGMKNEPTIDFDFKVTGYPAFIPAGTEQFVNPDPDHPGFYRGNSQAWDIAPWFDEQTLAESGYRKYRAAFADTGYAYEHRYSAGNLEDVAIVRWDKGWLSIETAGNLGAPPPPAYAWDLLSEVAQVRAHDGGIPEDGPSTVFPLKHVPVGLTADQLIAQLRPTLQDQADVMSDILVGQQSIASTSADFVFAPEGAQPMLWFRGASIDGSTSDKIVVVAGTRAEYHDDHGAAFALTVVSASPDEVVVEVVPIGEAGP